MEFKKCERCGCFFASENNVCCNCESKDSFEMSTLQDYLQINEINDTITNLSVNTGIAEKNINRFLNNMEGFKDV